MAERWKTQAFIASGGIFLSSYDMGLMAMALASMKHVWPLDAWQLAAVASVTSIGMIGGSLLGGILADQYGRRGVLVWDYVAFIGAAAVSALSPNLWWLLFARVIVGFGVDADFALSFAFLAEVCPPKKRGRTVNARVRWLANFGTVFAYGVGSLFLSFGGANGWRWTLGTGVFLAVPLILMRSAVTESPLLQRDHHKSGTKWHEIIRDFKQAGV